MGDNKIPFPNNGGQQIAESQKKILQNIGAMMATLNKLLMPGQSLVVTIPQSGLVNASGRQPRDILLVSKPAVAINMDLR
jgi:archaellum component FlaF (FlaF/FlaG flagellin family)